MNVIDTIQRKLNFRAYVLARKLKTLEHELARTIKSKNILTKNNHAKDEEINRLKLENAETQSKLGRASIYAKGLQDELETERKLMETVYKERDTYEKRNTQLVVINCLLIISTLFLVFDC